MKSNGPDYSGMTINERLFAAGLLDAFDASIDNGDRPASIELLRHVNLAAEEAARIVDSIHANPARYGYPR